MVLNTPVTALCFHSSIEVVHAFSFLQDSNRLEYLIPKKSSLRHRLPMGDQGFIDFVNHLLEVNPKKRPSASEALKHPWLSYPYEPISSWTSWGIFLVDETCWRCPCARMWVLKYKREKIPLAAQLNFFWLLMWSDLAWAFTSFMPSQSIDRHVWPDWWYLSMLPLYIVLFYLWYPRM